MLKYMTLESESRSAMSNSLQPRGLYHPWNSPGQNTGVGSLSFLQGIFPTQGSNPDLPHCSQILYQVSHKGSSRILEWVAYPFSSGSSRPAGIKPGSPALQADSLPAGPQLLLCKQFSIQSIKNNKNKIFILPSFILSLGEGNGTPLQYSCLENPKDGGAC